MRKSQPKLVLFDLDGTLANSLEIGLNAMNRLRFVFGYRRLDKNDPRLRQISGPEFVKVFLGLNTAQALAWIILLKWLVGRQADKIRLFAGVLPMVRALKKVVPVGIVTSAPKRYTQIILKNGRLPKFDVMETNVKYLAKDVRLAKILKRKNLKPRQVLYVGDELRDAQACAKIGVPFLAVAWGKDHADVFRGYPKVGVAAKPSEILRFST